MMPQTACDIEKLAQSCLVSSENIELERLHGKEIIIQWT